LQPGFFRLKIPDLNFRLLLSFSRFFLLFERSENASWRNKVKPLMKRTFGA